MQNLEKYKSNRSKHVKQLQVIFAADYDEEVISQMYIFGQNVAKQQYSELEKRAESIQNDNQLSEDEKSSFIDYLTDENHENNQTVELISEMQIVALFKSAEIAIKKMMKYSGLFTEKELKSAYMFTKLTEAAKNKLALDINTLNGYAAFDELRLINNAIKHSGLVSDDLAKYPNWKKGAKIGAFHESYQRLYQDVRKFVFDFRDKILTKL